MKTQAVAAAKADACNQAATVIVGKNRSNSKQSKKKPVAGNQYTVPGNLKLFLMVHYNYYCISLALVL
jgi:hypothetical protein